MNTVKLLKNLALVSLLFSVAGCAVNRSVVPVDVVETIENPTNGIEVKIISVEDTREFQFKPKTPDIPSLSEDEVNNDNVKARAIGRKRNGYGQALGDVLLPEGQTVARVMKTALSNSFRFAGYRVLKPTDANYASAVPVRAKVTQFWSWIEWGFWQLKVHNKSEVTLRGPIAKLENGLTVSNQHTGSHSAVFESDWQESASKGLEELNAKVTGALKIE